MKSGTKVCAGVNEARDELKYLRSTVARIAAEHGLAPIAASCHPFSDWRDQHHTKKDRYNELHDDLAGVVQRLLICGCHVHVGIPEKAMRIDLVNQLKYFLPHLLALIGAREIVPFPKLIDELVTLVEEDAEALGCEQEVKRAKEIARKGNAADQQRRIYSIARSSGADHDTALGAVVNHLIEEFHADL